MFKVPFWKDFAVFWEIMPQNSFTHCGPLNTKCIQVYLGWDDMQFDLIGDIYFYNVSAEDFCPTTEITKQMFLYSKY